MRLHVVEEKKRQAIVLERQMVETQDREAELQRQSIKQKKRRDV